MPVAAYENLSTQVSALCTLLSHGRGGSKGQGVGTDIAESANTGAGQYVGEH